MSQPEPSESPDSIRVLHVDDDLNQLSFSKVFLESTDPSIQVVSVLSPNDALKLLRKESFDSVVSDYQMPGLDGIELARRIRETSDIPFIIYTGHGSEEVAEAAFTAGVDDYLQKEMNPSHFQVLAKRIRTTVEKRRVEKELKESEELYRSLVETSPYAITLTDLKGNLLVTNQQAARLHGYNSIEEMLSRGRNAFSLIEPEDRERAAENAQKTMETGMIRNVQYRMLRVDGSSFPAELSASLIKDQEGAPKAFIGVIRDISIHKRYMESLEALHTHATILNSARDLTEVCETTLDAMERALGFDFASFLVVEGDRLEAIGGRGAPVLNIPLLLDGKGITVKAANTKRTVLISDLRDNTDFVKGSTESLSELAVPVIVDDETVAVLNVESIKLDAFTENDKRLLETLATHVSSAMRGIKERDMRRKHLERLEALHRHATELVQVETLEEIGEKTFDAIESVLGFDLGSLSVVERDLLRHVYIRGFEVGETFEMPLDGPGVTVRTIQTGETQLILDVRKEKSFVIGLADSIYTPMSELAVPVVIEDTPCGVINMESTELGAFTDEDKKLSEIFAKHVASAIDRLEKVSELERLVEEKTRELLDAEMIAAAGSVAAMVGHDLRGPLQTIKNAAYILRMSPERVKRCWGSSMTPWIAPA